jgi:hypothetical protein
MSRVISHLDGGGLAGAVRTEQTEQLPLLDAEGDVAHRLDVFSLSPDDAGVGAIAATEVRGFDDEHALEPSPDHPQRRQARPAVGSGDQS